MGLSLARQDIKVTWIDMILEDAKNQEKKEFQKRLSGIFLSHFLIETSKFSLCFYDRNWLNFEIKWQVIEDHDVYLQKTSFVQEIKMINVLRTGEK